MQVIFESRDSDGARMRELSVDRIRFVLRRLATLVPRAKVQFSDVNGPRGGVDKRCQIELSTEAVGTLVIASLARDWRTALDNALARAARCNSRSHLPAMADVKPASASFSGSAVNFLEVKKFSTN